MELLSKIEYAVSTFSFPSEELKPVGKRVLSTVSFNILEVFNNATSDAAIEESLNVSLKI